MTSLKILNAQIEEIRDDIMAIQARITQRSMTLANVQSEKSIALYMLFQQVKEDYYRDRMLELERQKAGIIVNQTDDLAEQAKLHKRLHELRAQQLQEYSHKEDELERKTQEMKRIKTQRNAIVSVIAALIIVMLISSSIVPQALAQEATPEATPIVDVVSQTEEAGQDGVIINRPAGTEVAPIENTVPDESGGNTEVILLGMFGIGSLVLAGGALIVVAYVVRSNEKSITQLADRLYNSAPEWTQSAIKDFSISAGEKIKGITDQTETTLDDEAGRYLDQFIRDYFQRYDSGELGITGKPAMGSQEVTPLGDRVDEPQG